MYVLMKTLGNKNIIIMIKYGFPQWLGAKSLVQPKRREKKKARERETESKE